MAPNSSLVHAKQKLSPKAEDSIAISSINQKISGKSKISKKLSTKDLSNNKDFLTPAVHDDKFYYFGYGSNMLRKRIHVQNPTAVRIGPAVLKDYRLDFNSFTPRWRGAAATIVPAEKFEVHGTLWEINLSNLKDIDQQEGVHERFYEPILIEVERGKETVIARSYQMVQKPIMAYHKRPSKTYLRCLVKGAMESQITPWYITWLKSLKHNGIVQVNLEKYLELKDLRLNKPVVRKIKRH